MIVLSRAQIKRAPGVDTTVRANIPYISPDWDHVLGYKNGSLSQQDYEKWYLERLSEQKDFVKQYVKNLQQQNIVFLCYCKDGDFCHTHILIDFLVNNWPTEFKRK